MPDLRSWGVKDGRNEGWNDGWIERWLEARAGYAEPRGRAGLALSGDLIKGGPGPTPLADFQHPMGARPGFDDCSTLWQSFGLPQLALLP